MASANDKSKKGGRIPYNAANPNEYWKLQMQAAKIAYEQKFGFILDQASSHTTGRRQVNGSERVISVFFNPRFSKYLIDRRASSPMSKETTAYITSTSRIHNRSLGSNAVNWAISPTGMMSNITEGFALISPTNQNAVASSVAMILSRSCEINRVSYSADQQLLAGKFADYIANVVTGLLTNINGYKAYMLAVCKEIPAEDQITNFLRNEDYEMQSEIGDLPRRKEKVSFDDWAVSVNAQESKNPNIAGWTNAMLKFQSKYEDTDNCSLVAPGLVAIKRPGRKDARVMITYEGSLRTKEEAPMIISQMVKFGTREIELIGSLPERVSIKDALTEMIQLDKCTFPTMYSRALLRQLDAEAFFENDIPRRADLVTSMYQIAREITMMSIKVYHSSNNNILKDLTDEEIKRRYTDSRLKFD